MRQEKGQARTHKRKQDSKKAKKQTLNEKETRTERKVALKTARSNIVHLPVFILSSPSKASYWKISSSCHPDSGFEVAAK